MNDKTLHRLISQLNNILTQKRYTTPVPNTKLNRQVLTILYNAGFITQFIEVDINTIFIHINNFNNKSIKYKLTQISTPGKRVYVSTKALNHLYRKYHNCHLLILSTGQGLMSLKAAAAANIGGEVLLLLNHITH
jgi:small subunit ribosomal protein S8